MGVPIFGAIARKIFGTRNQRMINRFLRVVSAVNKLEPSIRALTDAQLLARTAEFRKRIADGETPLSLMPDMLATAREAMDRAVGIRNIFNPATGFDPACLPAEARKLFDETKAVMDATPAAKAEGDFLGGNEPVPSWLFVEIPVPLYDAVREIYPQSRPPFRARPFDVQIIGGVVLSSGQIAEMKTGEGKTIVGPLACYLNACERKQVHVVTVNDYLVQRDRDWTFPFFRALGLTVGAIHPQHMQDQEQKRAAYRCDVVYGTTAEFGFDYLRDNMKLRPEDQVQRSRDFAIVDEVDSILIDEARTPLIISGLAERQRPRYEMANTIAIKLVEAQKPWTEADEQVQACRVELSTLEGDIRNARDKAAIPQMRKAMQEARARLPQLEAKRGQFKQFYEVELDKKKAVLTHDGIGEAQRIANVGSFYVGENMDMPHLLEQAIRAHVVYQHDRDYVVATDGDGDRGVVIVDQNTGRKMVGRQWSDGLHQAVEAKEGVKVKDETQTMATVTIQNYFKLYKRLAGMTGTADTEATEFHEIYRLDVVSIPTNVPACREDRHDLVFLGEKDKWKAIIDEIARLHDIGRPVLVGTTSVDKSEKLSGMLSKGPGIKHEVLNAKQHEREAEIVSNAGQLAAVMVATNMAGRGTDIKLGKIDRAALIEHWKKRDLAPREVEAAWDDARILGAIHKHLLVRRAKMERATVAAMDDTAARLALLRHWVVELRGVSEKRAQAASEADLLKELDALGSFRLHRLELWTSVEAMGGLHIIGTERHESRRIDNQLRGRSGRQGDKGSSRFFLSLEDDLMKIFAGKATLGLLSKLGMKEGDSIEAPMLNRAVEKAQRKVEERNFQMRKQILEYDEPMEYQRQGFYGLRQPILESLDIRGATWRFLEPAIHEAVALYLGPLHVANCVSEWAREKMGVQIDPSRIRGKDRDQIHKMLVVDALEDAQHKIELVVAEIMPEEMDPAEFDVAGLQKWASDTYGMTIDADFIRAGDRRAVRQRIEEASHKHIEAIDLTPLDSILIEDYSAKELSLWAERYLSVKIDPAEFASAEDLKVASDRLVKRALEAYAERERAYPIDFVIKYTSARLQSDAQGAITSFCAWVNGRYQLGWRPESLPSSNPVELRDLVMTEARKFDDSRIAARAEQCLAAGADVEAVNAWLLVEYQSELTEHDRKAFPADPKATVEARIRESMRAELSQFERWVMLQTLDNAWKDHLRGMDQIRDAIGFRAFSQKDPRIEFKKEAARLYNEMLEGIQNRLTEVLLKGELVPQAPKPEAAPAPDAGKPALPPLASATPAAPAANVVTTHVASKRPQSGQPSAVVGRNEMCPCGSGKKFKHCHGAKGPVTPQEQT
ncbi:MAG: preprotein translocase subunit SecA [Planctomycetes bacterium]|nr:preprotein translocase subunit SecA [Planctomycetota bacterium]